MKKTHYDALGLTSDATPEEIKEAYRRLRGGLHPDREGGDTEAMAAVNAAYTVLSDPVMRAAYDAKLPDAQRSAVEALEAMLSKHLEGEDDPIAASHKDIDAALLLAAKNRRIALNAVKTLRRHLTKLRFKGQGENVATRLLKKKIAQRQEDAEDFAHMLEVFNRVRALLMGYEYEQPVVNPAWGGDFDLDGQPPYGLSWGRMLLR